MSREQVAHDEDENSKKSPVVSAQTVGVNSIPILGSIIGSGIAPAPIASRPAGRRLKSDGYGKRRIMTISKACQICCGCRTGAAHTPVIGIGEPRSAAI
jgi:hypothetical protein